MKLNNKITIYFDMNDEETIQSKELYFCDYYFKRSFSSKGYSDLELGYKIKPYGLNMEIYNSKIDYIGITRSLGLYTFPASITQSTKYIPLLDFFTKPPRFNLFNDNKSGNLNNKILFICKAYDPFDRRDRPEYSIQDRIELNEFRADTILTLKREFKNKVTCGFQYSEFAFKMYPDLVFSKYESLRNVYYDRVASHGICIANRGLMNSNGHKLPEYVCFSRAIVSEELYHSVPYGFANGKNYLQYKTVNECIEKVTSIYTDENLRNILSENNRKYYDKYLRPDSLLLNCFRQIGFDFI